MKTGQVFALLLGALAPAVCLADTVTVFEATLTSDSVVRQGIVGTPSTLTGSAVFVLTEPAVGEPTVRYKITLPGADLDPLNLQTPDLNDDVTAVHIHDTTAGGPPTWQPGDTAGSLHALNIYLAPRADDADLTVDFGAKVLRGFWDAGDANPTPPPSSAPSANLTQLLNGEVFLMVHTREVPSGAYGGFITQVPEPGSVGLGLLGGCLLATRRR